MGVVSRENRAEFYRQKVRVFSDAQRDGVLAARPDAAHLLFLVLALADWWFAVPQLARMLTGSAGDTADEQALRRASIVECARRLASPA